MSKTLGYIFGALFLLAFLVGPAAGLYFVSKDTIESLGYSGRAMGVIEGCTSIRVKGSNSVKYNRVPKVRLKSGQIVRGTVDEIRFLYVCDDRVGDEVEVRFDLKKPTNAKLNTFHEMWFLSIVLLIVNLIWYPACIIGYRKKLKSKRG
ncbi:MAG: hypothetical protein ACJAT2_000202 [Bacteriovoracaceae bacterium]|jgi:hypothetical protein